MSATRETVEVHHGAVNVTESERIQVQRLFIHTKTDDHSQLIMMKKSLHRRVSCILHECVREEIEVLDARVRQAVGDSATLALSCYRFGNDNNYLTLLHHTFYQIHVQVICFLIAG